MRAVLLWIVSDFPTYAMLSGWSTHDRLACPYCSNYSGSFQLQFGGKACWFDCHKQHLPTRHCFRKDKINFRKNIAVKHEIHLPEPSGEEIWQTIQHFPTVYQGKPYGKGYKKPPGFGVTHNWVKRSIFWELPYWHKLLIRHNLDVMHIEKNVFENLFYTIMGTDNSKDNMKARQDIESLCDRPLLNPICDSNGKMTKVRGDYTLQKDDAKNVCVWLKKLKFPDGYASNIGSCVNIEKYSFYSFKSDDCHVFMQRLLPLAIRGSVSKETYEAVTELCMFFQVLCSKTLHIYDLVNMKRTIVQTVCKLEKIFPPGFFDSMEHLVIHLADEALLVVRCNTDGCINMRGSLKLRHATQNFAPQHPSSSGGDSQLSMFVVPSRRLYEKGGKRRHMDAEEHKKAHTYVILNCEEVPPYVIEFDKVAPQLYPDEPTLFLKDDHFADWFKTRVRMGLSDGSTRYLEILANKPSKYVQSHNGYFVNGYKFHTQMYGKGLVTNNYGVFVRGEAHIAEESDYYGLLDEVIELQYYGNGPHTVVLFNCTWFDNNRGVIVNKNKLVDVNPKYQLRSNDPFVLASQAKQVFYTSYPAVTRDTKGLWAVVKTKAQHIYEVANDGNTEAHEFLQINERFELPNEAEVFEEELFEEEEFKDDEHTSDDDDDDDDDQMVCSDPSSDEGTHDC
ncbi:uncharacterized protein LOC143609445 [Bidens hawaiensis]|uniref:uncharacterized protein LOC143609445 n=1 Tax=Bidens hawaiensis TaxID=980011 RepID=UPI00404ABD7B